MDETRTLTLDDGRTLAYTDSGDPDGQPIIFFHGNPGSRYMRHPDDDYTASLGARIIVPDRPGYGQSDFQKGRTLLDMGNDIAQLADALKLDTFALMGVSAGGPYVLSTAYRLGERVRVGAVVSGAAPFNRDGALDDVNDTYRQAYQVAKWPGWLLRILMRAQMKREAKDLDGYWQEVLGRASEADRATLERPEIAAQVKAYRPEAVRRGVQGWVHEARLVVTPWGFPLNDITPTIHLWYWNDDTIVPTQMGRFLEAALPNTVSHFLPGGGHFAFFDHWGDILRPLIAN